MRPIARFPRPVTPALALALFWTSSAIADVQDPNGKVLKPGDLTMAFDSQTGGPRTVWLAYQGARPTESPGPLGGPMGNKPAFWPTPIRFMEAFKYALKHTIDRKTYYLLVTSNPDGTAVRDIAGWVDERYLVHSTSALIDAATKILRKGIIVNAPGRQGADGTPDVIEQRLVFRMAPVADGPTGSKESPLSNLFFIYGETEKHLLLGTRAQFSTFPDPDEPSKVLMGWAPKDRICQWLTREAFEWAPSNSDVPRATPGRIFRTSELARDAAKGKSVDAFMVEGRNKSGGFGQEWPFDKIRYPILPWDSGELVPQTLDGKNRMYRVGVVGGFANSKFDAEGFRIAAQRAAEQAGAVEILFVVDETSSMINHFRTVSQMVRKVVNGVTASNSGTVKVGVAFYGDLDGGGVPAKPGPLIDARKSGTALADELANHKEQNGGDPLERVFYGIRQAIKGANFSSGARKIVVVIGDLGNKNVSGDPSVDDLARLLVKPDDPEIPIEFFAIQVCDPDLPSNNKNGEARAFRAEMKAIIARTEQLVAQKYRIEKNRAGAISGTLSDYQSVSPQDVESDRQQILGLIGRQYSQSVVQARDISNRINRLPFDPETVIGPEYEKLLRDEFNYDLEELRKTKDFQIFSYGYVWRENEAGLMQIRVRLLINSEELAGFLQVLKTLNTGIGRLNKDPADFVRKIIETMVGDAQKAGEALNLKGTSVADIVRKSSGLEVRSPILNRRMEDLNKSLNTPFRLGELHLVRYKLLKLQDLQDGIEQRYEAIKVNDGGVIYKTFKAVGKVRDNQRGFKLNSDQVLSWYWVDLAEEWP